VNWICEISKDASTKRLKLRQQRRRITLWVPPKKSIRQVRSECLRGKGATLVCRGIGRLLCRDGQRRPEASLCLFRGGAGGLAKKESPVSGL